MTTINTVRDKNGLPFPDNIRRLFMNIDTGREAKELADHIEDMTGARPRTVEFSGGKVARIAHLTTAELRPGGTFHDEPAEPEPAECGKCYTHRKVGLGRPCEAACPAGTD